MSWPFQEKALAKGLREPLGAPDLSLDGIHPMQRPPTLPGMHGEKIGQYRLHLLAADLNISGQPRQLALLLKELIPASGKAGEHYFYRHLATHLPIYTPLMIAGDDNAGWLVTLAPGELRAPESWDVDDYRAAVDSLAVLHDCYWGLYDDLDNFANLRHPLDSGHNHLVTEIQDAVKFIIQNYPEFAMSRYAVLLECLMDRLEEIAGTLKKEPFTLLHGNYWPDNIARPIDGGRQQVANWHQAAIGPAVLDAVMFAQQTVTYLQPVFPLTAALARYRVQLRELRGETIWNDQQWNLLWDYSLLWLLMADRLPWIVALPPEMYHEWHPSLQRFWFDPAAQILKTRFGITLPG